jgi:hypothetical protein
MEIATYLNLSQMYDAQRKKVGRGQQQAFAIETATATVDARINGFAYERLRRKHEKLKLALRVYKETTPTGSPEMVARHQGWIANLSIYVTRLVRRMAIALNSHHESLHTEVEAAARLLEEEDPQGRHAPSALASVRRFRPQEDQINAQIVADLFRDVRRGVWGPMNAYTAAVAGQAATQDEDLAQVATHELNRPGGNV